ncbi:MAG TPA: FmdB family zinc ribbon protein [Terracidiphilus sp.]|nr:FmdB family zinc ribbon protein [Terracidiphilus sp.]
MPLYAYRCTKCGHRLEKIQSFASEPLTECPKCHGPLERPLTAPALQFKGAGWYVNDYAGKAKSAPDSTSSDSASSDSASSDSASAAKPKTDAAAASSDSKPAASDSKSASSDASSSKSSGSSSSTSSSGSSAPSTTT